jgi:hypothetical protein
MSSHSDISEHQNLDHCMNSTRKLLTWSSKKQGDLQITISEVAVECRDDAGPGFGLGDVGALYLSSSWERRATSRRNAGQSWASRRGSRPNRRGGRGPYQGGRSARMGCGDGDLIRLRFRRVEASPARPAIGDASRERRGRAAGGRGLWRRSTQIVDSGSAR